MSVESQDEYVTVLAVSLDGKDLAGSAQILVQIGTTSRPYGWRTQAQGENRKIVSLGGPPWNVVKAKLNLGLKNSRVKRAEVLDGNFRM